MYAIKYLYACVSCVIVLVKFISKCTYTNKARRTKVCRNKKRHKSMLAPNIYVTIRYTLCCKLNAA